MVCNNQMVDITWDEVMVVDVWQGSLTSRCQDEFSKVMLDVF